MNEEEKEGFAAFLAREGYVVLPPLPWYKEWYHRAADRVWRIRWSLARLIAGCDIDCY